MYLRFIRLVVREGAEAEFQKFYRERVIPALTAVPGCMFAGLLTPWRSEEHRSLTLWRSAEEAAAYEKSGLYHELLRVTASLLSSRTVWRAKLAVDPLETQEPPDAETGGREIPPEGYSIPENEAQALLGLPSRRLFVRVVAVHVAPERRQEFHALFHQRVIPQLENVSGCKGVLLAEGLRDPGEALSISVWDREESATRYEMSGEFERLTRLLEPVLSQVAHWRLILGEGSEGGGGGGVAAGGQVEGDDRQGTPEVGTFYLVQGRKLDPDDEFS